ncbi:cbb3-type cytochrome c oxidase subunit I [Acetobacter vaccinii]|uniref:Cytochrome C oxidase subunit I n=1 Tax=Acetobacter vaccinii TaxID=2592655 RepID=A0A5C1YR04_9PROT|nr:cbb3-type cytochrome c oxidase subunit I [Acetobacter vaccinii]QEO18055.1 cytochrome C oxidase subunit I [Acetobacter vaccinii]
MTSVRNRSQQRYSRSGRGQKDGVCDIRTGSAYLGLAALAGLVGGGIAVMARVGQLPAMPGLARLTQVHSILMLLYLVVPALVGGFGTLWLPRALGRARILASGLNTTGLWLTVAGACGTLLAAGHDTGLRCATLLWCAGTLLTSMALLATVFDSRADSLQRQPFSPFVWGQTLAASSLLLMVPVFAAHIVRGWGQASLSVSSAVAGFAAPVSLVVLLVGFGLVFDMTARVGRSAIRPVVAVMAITAATGVVAWVKASLLPADMAGQALQIGGALVGLYSLSAIAMAVAWVAATWKASITLRTPLLWGMGFVGVVAAGWGAQFLLGAGLHSALQLGALYAICGGFYLWRGEECGFWYPQRLARLHFFLTLAATLLVFVPGQQVSGAALFGLAALCFVVAAVSSFRKQAPASVSTVLQPAPVRLGQSRRGFF